MLWKFSLANGQVFAPHRLRDGPAASAAGSVFEPGAAVGSLAAACDWNLEQVDARPHLDPATFCPGRGVDEWLRRVIPQRKRVLEEKIMTCQWMNVGMGSQPLSQPA